jgi:molecular chaperone GrpE
MKNEPEKKEAAAQAPAPADSPETSNPSTGEATVPKAEYDAAATQAAELKDRLLRGQAEWENSRKRILREKEDAVRYAGEALLEKLLPVLDNFEMGMKAAETATDAKSIAQGLEMVLKQFQQVLKDAGVETIEAVGQPFDPHRHEALGQQESAEHPEGHVALQMRKGYKLKDRLLRAASVFVAKPPEGKQAKK